MFKTFSLLLILFTFSCKSQDCETIPTSFSSHQDATQVISNTDFNLSDDVNTSKSSWIRTAEYYSCNEKLGFLIIGTDKKNYLFQGVPIEVWNGFKEANSFGKYYNSYIRGNYQLNLK